MAQHVEAHIIIEGKTISPFSSISISQDIHQHHAFEIILPADAFKDTSKAILQQSKDYIGKEIHIRFGIKLFKTKHENNEFVGLITEVGLSRFTNGARKVVLRGNSPTILMDGKEECRTFSEMKLSDIAMETMSEIPHPFHVHGGSRWSSSFPYVTQYKESNFDFLRRLAASYGEWFFYNGTELVFGPLISSTPMDLPFNKDLFNFEFSLKLKPANYKIISYNYLDNTTFQSTASSASVNDLDEFAQFTLDQSTNFFSRESVTPIVHNIASQPELDKLAEEWKASATRDMVMASGTSDNPYLNVGNIINITGESANEQDYGEFILTSVIHTISGTYSYENSFSAIPADIPSPPLPLLKYPVAEIQPAVVKENHDPEGLGRVRVQFPWQDSSSMTPWVRIANPSGGKGNKGEHYGFYFIPEVGTEVLVGFEHGNLDKPFVLGSVYHGKAAPEAWVDGNNNIKAIKTRNGNQILFMDEDGKEQIRIVNKNDKDATNEISLSLEENGKIMIKTKGKLDLSAKSINIAAEEEIKITSGKTTDFSAQGMSINTQKDINLKTQQMNLEATKTSIISSAQLEIDGGQSSIKAKMLQIDGGGMATVTAGLIKLN